MERFFRFITRISMKRPKLVLTISVIFTIIMLLLASRLKLEMTWLNMIPQTDPSAKLYNEVLKEFGNEGGFLIGVEHPVPESLIAIAQEVKDSVEKISGFTKSVTMGVPEEFIKIHGLMLVDSSSIERVSELLTTANLDSFIFKYNNILEKEYIENEENLSAQELEAVQSIISIEDFIYGLNRYISSNGRDDALFKIGTEELITGPVYFKSLDNRMILLSIQPNYRISDMTSFPLIVTGVDSIRALLKRIEKRHRNSRIMDTGIYSVMRDEYVTGISDMNLTTIISFVLVIGLFIYGFRILLAPIFAGIPLIMGIIWALGLTEIFIGRLNMMTAMIGAILIGLGIDYSIHMLQATTEREGIQGTLSKVGRGLVIGALTTAMAFFSLYFTSFDILKELGIVVGLGCITTVSATMFVLPALISLWGKRLGGKNLKTPAFGRLAEFLSHRWIIPLIIGLSALSLIPYGLKHLKTEANPIKLEAKGLASVAANDTLIKRFGMSTDYLMAIAGSYEESDSIAHVLKKIDGVNFIEGIHIYCPPIKQQEYIRGFVEKIHKNAVRMRYHPANREFLLKEIERLKNNIIEIKSIAFLSGLDRVYENADDFIKSGFLDSLISTVRNAKANQIKNASLLFFNVAKPIIISASNPEYIKLEDVPQTLRERFVSKDGKKFLLTIFTKGDIWKDVGSGSIIDRVKSRVNVTGMPILIRVLWTTGSSESKKALGLVFITIFILLLLDFRSIRESIIAYIPVLLAFFTTIVVLALIKLPLNFLNVLAFPLIIGIGIDDAVHVMHRYLKEGSVNLVYTLIGRAIFYTTLTTGAAFGSMLLAKYRGYFSFGAVILVGITLALIFTLIVLPPLLRLVKRR